MNENNFKYDPSELEEFRLELYDKFLSQNYISVVHVKHIKDMFPYMEDLTAHEVCNLYQLIRLDERDIGVYDNDHVIIWSPYIESHYNLIETLQKDALENLLSPGILVKVNSLKVSPFGKSARELVQELSKSKLDYVLFASPALNYHVLYEKTAFDKKYKHHVIYHTKGENQ